MILKMLILKNYRKFKHITIDFPDGTTGVIGLNGVGNVSFRIQAKLPEML